MAGVQCRDSFPMGSGSLINLSRKWILEKKASSKVAGKWDWVT